MFYFNIAIIFFYSVAVAIVLFILVYLSLIKRKLRTNIELETLANELVGEAIFTDSEDADTLIPISQFAQNKLFSPRFKSIIYDKIILTTKSISGQSFFYLQKLFIQLELDVQSFKLLESNQWPLIAKGIQDIGIMGLNQYLPKVSTFTNHSNEFVRKEAQITVLKLSGFKGLIFLDNITQTLSEWEQIMLLKELANLPLEQFSGIEKWLKSANESVVIFALKLARNYHKFELYNDIVDCLKHNNGTVRLNAIYALAEVYNQDTPQQLISHYTAEGYEQQLAIVIALQNIGDDDITDNLIQYLNTEIYEMKFTIARAIANISNYGYEKLLTIPEAQHYPLNEMLLQIKSEMKQ